MGRSSLRNSIESIIPYYNRQYHVKKYIRNHLQKQFMAKMLSCPCGWTLISPQGVEDIKKHAMIHAKDYHPGLTETEDEVAKMIKTI